MQIKINRDQAQAAMTKLLLGKPGGLIALMSPDKSALNTMTPGRVSDIKFDDKTLVVYVGCMLSLIKTRDLWIMVHLLKMK